MTDSNKAPEVSCEKSSVASQRNSSGSSTQSAKHSTEVPIFLRKTYHMIDTCDENIASWGEDGSSFVVKQPDTFEKVVIPQFFKHSKFSSFVRQLNFYGFRKIKYSDSILIDKDLEEKTANYWRFRHENFKKGREDLLIEIKRSNAGGSSGNPNVSGGGNFSSTAKDLSRNATQEAGSHAKGYEDVSKNHVLELKGEVDLLKDKIKEMSNNIDELTSLVKCVSLKADTASSLQQQTTHVATPTLAMKTATKHVECDNVTVGFKRKYPQERFNVVKEDVHNVTAVGMSEPVLSHHTIQMDLDDASDADEAFVNELFHALDHDDDLEILPEPDWMSCHDDTDAVVSSATCKEKGNAPDEKMMSKLSDALAVLPKDVQEMLIDRIISTIHNADALKSYMENTRMEKKELSLSSCRMSAAAVTAADVSFTKKTPVCMVNKEQNSDVVIPLAAATLTAFMTQFSAGMKDKKKAVVNTSKTIPVIPIHA